MQDNVKVILIDDDKSARLGTEQALELAGLKVELVSVCVVGPASDHPRIELDRCLRRADARYGWFGAAAEIASIGSRHARHSYHGAWRRKHGR